MKDQPEATLYLKIQDLSVSDRPREKLIQRGSSSLTDAELLAIIIGSGIKNMSAVTLAQYILRKHNNDLHLLAKRSVKELQEFKGIGMAKAITIVSAMEIGRRRSSQVFIQKPQVNDSVGVYTIMKTELMDKYTEEFWVLLLNKANFLIKKICISSGGFAATIVDPKVLFKVALEYSASAMIIVHNHPSGNLKPSQADIKLTEKLVAGGQLLDIPILDHIIFTEENYFSFADAHLVL